MRPNNTKQSAVVYDNLAHFLFNQLVRAHNNQNSFDLLSPWTWLTIFSWITSGIALVLVILLRIKLRSLTLLLMAGSAHATSLARVPRILALTTTPIIEQPGVDLFQQWIDHVSHVPNLMPIEVLILLCLIFLFLFKLARIIYKTRRAETVRTSLVLDIGNDSHNVLIPIMNLAYTPQNYRFIICKADIEFMLVESNFSAELRWNKGIMLLNSTLNCPIFLPPKLMVPFWQMKLLKSVLQGTYFAAIQMVSGPNMDLMELVVLRTHGDDFEPQQPGLYPALN